MNLELDKNRNSVPESDDVFLFCSSAIDWEGYVIMERIVGKFYKFESHKFENNFLTSRPSTKSKNREINFQLEAF